MTKEEILQYFSAINYAYNDCSRYGTLKRMLDELTEPCEDAISRKDLIEFLEKVTVTDGITFETGFKQILTDIRNAPSVQPKQKMGRCKDCKYFEYDSVAKVDGIPLIVAHEICSKWGGGCKTKEDGYCFLFEPQESEG
jgi:hypothetical protein